MLWTVSAIGLQALGKSNKDWLCSGFCLWCDNMEILGDMSFTLSRDNQWSLSMLSLRCMFKSQVSDLLTHCNSVEFS